MAFEKSSEKIDCRFSVYDGDTLLESNLRQLPCPPTGLRARLPSAVTPSSAQIEWDYVELPFPGAHFAVEYRRESSSDSWIQQRTTEPDQTRLTVSLLPTGPSIEFRIAVGSCIGLSQYSDVVCAMLDKNFFAIPPCDGAVLSETTSCNPSETFESSTPFKHAIRFAEKLARRCQKIGKEHGLDRCRFFHSPAEPRTMLHLLFSYRNLRQRHH